MADYIDTKQVGDKITIKYFRDGKTATTDLTLDAWKVSASSN